MMKSQSNFFGTENNQVIWNRGFMVIPWGSARAEPSVAARNASYVTSVGGDSPACDGICANAGGV